MGTFTKLGNSVPLGIPSVRNWTLGGGALTGFLAHSTSDSRREECGSLTQGETHGARNPSFTEWLGVVLPWNFLHLNQTVRMLGTSREPFYTHLMEGLAPREMQLPSCYPYPTLSWSLEP